MEHFPNPLNLFYVFVWERAKDHYNKKKTQKVIK